MGVMITFSHDEIQREIAYDLICETMEATASSTIDWIRSPIPVLSFSGISAFLRFLLFFIIPHLTAKRKKYLGLQTHVLFLFTLST